MNLYSFGSSEGRGHMTRLLGLENIHLCRVYNGLMYSFDSFDHKMKDCIDLKKYCKQILAGSLNIDWLKCLGIDRMGIENSFLLMR